MDSLKLCNKANYKIDKSYYAIGDKQMGEINNEEYQDDSIKEIIDSLMEKEKYGEEDKAISEILEAIDSNNDLQYTGGCTIDEENNLNAEEITELIIREKTVKENQKRAKIKIKVGTIFAVCVTALAVAFIVPTVMKQFSNYSFNKIVQSSMYPTLKNGDILIMEDCSMEDVEVGDIITYTGTLNGKVVDITHRVMSKEDYAITPDGINGTIISEKLMAEGYDSEVALVVKGDNNDAPDELYITESMIKGRIVYDLGPQVKILIILAIAIIIVSNIINILVGILNKKKQ